jgi:hypothetical protein
MFKYLLEMFDSDNRKLEAQWFLAVMACFIAFGLQIYVVVIRGPEHQTFDLTQFGLGIGALIGSGGAATALVGAGRKAQGQGDAAQTMADKVPPVTGEGAS